MQDMKKILRKNNNKMTAWVVQTLQKDQIISGPCPAYQAYSQKHCAYAGLCVFSLLWKLFLLCDSAVKTMF